MDRIRQSANPDQTALLSSQSAKRCVDCQRRLDVNHDADGICVTMLQERDTEHTAAELDHSPYKSVEVHHI